MSKFILGVDLSKLKFDVALLLENNKVKSKKFDNNLKGFTQLVDWLNLYKVQDLSVCMEATGIYGEALATYLFDAGHSVSVVNPAQVKGFAQSQLARIKTDKADAKLIAHFCRAIQPSLWQPKPLYIRELQALVRRLESVQGMYQQEYNRLDVAPPNVQESIESIKSKLEEEINSLKKKIKAHIDQDPTLRQKKELLITIPGVSDNTIAQVLGNIGHVEEFTSAKQLAAFVGLNPKQYSSGSSVLRHTRLSKVGDSRLRKAFYMPAIVAKQHNPIIKAFCERLKAAGKPPMCVIGAAMRKLIHIIYGVLKSGKPFNPALAV